MKKIVISFIAVPILIIAAGVSVTIYNNAQQGKAPAGIDEGEKRESTVSVRIMRESMFRNILCGYQVATIIFDAKVG